MPMVLVPESAYEKLRKLAELRGATVEELVLDLVADDMTTAEAVEAYWEAAKGLLSEAEEELSKGDLRQASEKIWGSAALAVKAVALAREGRRLASHGELWRFVSELARQEGDPDIRRLWHVATSMHVNYYEGWADEGLVRGALEDVRKLLAKLERLIKEEKR
ncbi:hypothetical protein B6U66_02890 [Candidatus Bathyarchaeota archaeon ex4484_135]|nr:MAG: hypothetical protein B6U66_02890 [Candidatus Bathyarchaeota archaeon ex4484_135]